ncbi:Hypothetical predicted protein [Octopus vulgaris]|uniref:Uncharacterized protein n=1 Tax=Octopus vulgaris TaxID=6645 RepID=A0AA36FDR4_OCTVU|nr:Hypothetical predicted protein [Octopus vulgaris]
MSDEFVDNMDEYFGVRMDMECIRIGKEHSSDGENQRTELKASISAIPLLQEIAFREQEVCKPSSRGIQKHMSINERMQRKQTQM